MKSTTFALVAAAIPFAFAAPFEKREGYEAVYVTDLKLTTVTTQLTVYYTGQPAAATVYATPAATPAAAPTDADIYTYVAPAAAAVADAAESVESAPAPAAVESASAPAADVASVQPETVVQQSAPVAPAAAPVVAQSSSYGPASSYPSSGSGSYDASTGALQSLILNSTNTWRALYQAGPVTWDDDLASAAQNNVNTCVFHHDEDRNVNGKGYGQNSASGMGSPTAVNDVWCNEDSSYSWSNPGFSVAAGHFSQVVWQSTTSVGCASKQCGDMGWYTICNYYPAGNSGSYQSNVLPRA